MTYVGFDVVVEVEGTTVLSGSSTFLLGAAASSPDDGEPDPEERGPNDPLPEGKLPPVGADIAWGRRSASRADLVRYAGASRDWNPVHWDHSAGRSAGLPGIVVHGLLQSAWMTAAVASLVPGDLPVAHARFRYRAPLRPGVTARLDGRVVAEDAVEATLVGPEGILAGATFTVGR